MDGSEIKSINFVKFYNSLFKVLKAKYKLLEKIKTVNHSLLLFKTSVYFYKFGGEKKY